VLTMLRIALRGEAREVEPALAKARSQADAEMAQLIPRLNLAEQTIVRHLVARAQKAAVCASGCAHGSRACSDAERRRPRRRSKARPPRPELASAPAEGAPPHAATPSVFFLTLDEIVVALRTSRAELAPLVRARRAEFARDCARPDPPATFVGTPPSVVLRRSVATSRGLPASAGIVEGRARVLLTADAMGELQTGEILVVHTTDVGWTPLFLLAAGVSRSSWPALARGRGGERVRGAERVNVEGATRAIRTGDLVRVDGERASSSG